MGRPRKHPLEPAPAQPAPAQPADAGEVVLSRNFGMVLGGVKHCFWAAGTVFKKNDPVLAQLLIAGAEVE